MQTRYLLGSIAAALVALATATPAHACPDGAQCMDLTQGDSARQEVPLAPSAHTLPPLDVVVAQLELDEDNASPADFQPLPVIPDRTSFDALWKQARAGVYRHLPTYHGADYSLMASPVVLETSFAKIPGLGVSGDY